MLLLCEIQLHWRREKWDGQKVRLNVTCTPLPGMYVCYNTVTCCIWASQHNLMFWKSKFSKRCNVTIAQNPLFCLLRNGNRHLSVGASLGIMHRRECIHHSRRMRWLFTHEVKRKPSEKTPSLTYRQWHLLDSCRGTHFQSRFLF